jgi:hypothetical protein
MPSRMFNALLRKAGFPLCKVRLVRHKDHSAEEGRTPYDLWHNNRLQFNRYNSTHSFRYRKTLNAPYWAVFLGTPDGRRTMFVGIYGVGNRGLLEQDTRMPHRDGVYKARKRDVYELTLEPELDELIGKLFIDWGEGARGRLRGAAHRSWVQYADRHDKPITELRK